MHLAKQTDVRHVAIQSKVGCYSISARVVPGALPIFFTEFLNDGTASTAAAGAQVTVDNQKLTFRVHFPHLYAVHPMFSFWLRLLGSKSMALENSSEICRPHVQIGRDILDFGALRKLLSGQLREPLIEALLGVFIEALPEITTKRLL